MRKLLLISMISICSLASAQDNYQDLSLLAYESPKIDLKLPSTQATKVTKRYGYSEPSIPLGLGMVMGGTAFVIAGVLTTPDYYVDDNGQIKNKPFWKQGARMMAIVSGAGLFTAGIVVSIGR